MGTENDIWKMLKAKASMNKYPKLSSFKIVINHNLEQFSDQM